ncbi:MAG: hypothetical protein ACFFD1_01180 [Candidatus Thorarchaeota archaeon]
MSSPLDDDEKDNRKEKGGKLNKAIDASKILVGALAVKAADELTKVVINYPKKPKNVTTREFTKTKPTKTFTEAARTVHYWEKNPDSIPVNNKDVEQESWFDKTKRDFFKPKSQSSQHPPNIIPGIDGLVSFAILLVPFTLILGLLRLMIGDGLDILLLWFLLIYILFVAIPGAYLGLDAIRDGTRSLLVNSGATIKFGIKAIFYMIKIFIQGILELFILAFNIFYENIVDYWIFILSYVASAIGLFLIFNTLFPDKITLFLLFMLVLIPALLPAAIFHRSWILYRFKKGKYSYN